jgi:glucosamine-phosphate N-acetyltransferase
MNSEVIYMNLLNFINIHANDNTILEKIKNQYVDLLKNLTQTSDISVELFIEQVKQINHIGNIIIGIDGNMQNFTIIGSGTVIIEPKIIRNAGFVAHIEDIVVHSNYRGKGIAKNIISLLQDYSKLMNCYKIILNCKDEYIPLYEKNGFIKKGNEMSLYL